MNVRRYLPEDAVRIQRFNERLKAGGVRWTVYPESPHDALPGSPIRSRLFVAVDGDEVRGAVWLREHEFLAGGERVLAGWAKYPVSEGLLSPAFGGVAGAMMMRLVREQPRLMALGMGGQGGAFARLLKGMRWLGDEVPFYFLPERPFAVLRRLRHVRSTRVRRLVLDALAFSGMGWLGWKAVSAVRGLSGAKVRGVEAVVVDRFGSEADEVWERCGPAYGFLAVRDAAMLNAVYPAGMPVTRLLVRGNGRLLGWACVAQRNLTEADATPFGRLSVGLVADGLAAPRDAAAVVAAAAEYLRRAGMELLFSNQFNPAWTEALESVGFVRGPSQFAFLRAPRLASLAGEAQIAASHINRGDCDGPVFW
jgi:hypothetical protein